eukprot:PhM_4_TR13905/c3_g1_i2/m.96185
MIYTHHLNQHHSAETTAAAPLMNVDLKGRDESETRESGTAWAMPPVHTASGDSSSLSINVGPTSSLGLLYSPRPAEQLEHPQHHRQQQQHHRDHYEAEVSLVSIIQGDGDDDTADADDEHELDDDHSDDAAAHESNCSVMADPDASFSTSCFRRTTLGTTPTLYPAATTGNSVIDGLARLLLASVYNANSNGCGNSPTTAASSVYRGNAPIPIDAYVRRLWQLLPAAMGDAPWVVTAVLVDRWMRATGSPLTPATAHRLLLGLVLVAVQYVEDVPPPMCVVSRAGGVRVAELATLQMAVLRDLDWRLHVTDDLYLSYAKGLMTFSSSCTLAMSSSASFMSSSPSPSLSMFIQKTQRCSTNSNARHTQQSSSPPSSACVCYGGGATSLGSITKVMT